MLVSSKSYRWIFKVENSIQVPYAGIKLVLESTLGPHEDRDLAWLVVRADNRPARRPPVRGPSPRDELLVGTLGRQEVFALLDLDQARPAQPFPGAVSRGVRHVETLRVGIVQFDTLPEEESPQILPRQRLDRPDFA